MLQVVLQTLSVSAFQTPWVYTMGSVPAQKDTEKWGGGDLTSILPRVLNGPRFGLCQELFGFGTQSRI